MRDEAWRMRARARCAGRVVARARAKVEASPLLTSGSPVSLNLTLTLS